MTQETQGIKSERITLLQKEAYEVDLEFNEDFAILHLPFVDKFTKTVYLDFVSTLESLQSFLKTTQHEFLWVAIRPEDETLTKLLGKLGFEYQGSAEGLAVHNKRN